LFNGVTPLRWVWLKLRPGFVTAIHRRLLSRYRGRSTLKNSRRKSCGSSFHISRSSVRSVCPFPHKRCTKLAIKYEENLIKKAD